MSKTFEKQSREILDIVHEATPGDHLVSAVDLHHPSLLAAHQAEVEAAKDTAVAQELARLKNLSMRLPSFVALANVIENRLNQLTTKRRSE